MYPWTPFPVVQLYLICMIMLRRWILARSRKRSPKPVHYVVQIPCRLLWWLLKGPPLIHQSLDTDWGIKQKNIEDCGRGFLGRLEARHCCPTLHHLLPVNIPQAILPLLAYSRFNLSPLRSYKEDILQQSIAAQRCCKSAPGSPSHHDMIKCNLVKTNNPGDGHVSIFSEVR